MGKLHILMIPYPVQGHVIPFMQLAQSLAKYGFKITFAISESSHMCILNSLSGKNSLHDQIHLISVLDESESGDKNVPGSIFEAIFKVMPRKIEKLIQENNTSEVDQISCVIADLCFGWAMELAEKMRIKRATFITAAAANLLLGFNIPELIDDGIIDNDGGGEDDDKLTSKVRVQDSAVEESYDLKTLSIAKLISKLQAQEQRTSKRDEEVEEVTFQAKYKGK
ncbi:hypothetical protein FXO38_24563 [Capsicum annuum]|nr:hypothetical protein FXO38_24563 [Capsicum annuum]KAF3638418.1 hypothetical protein FXO37_24408 [Capsicum annuum]